MELLASNPRLISPCIDLPLASVQIERPGSLSSSGVPGYYYHMAPPPAHHPSLPWPPEAGPPSCDCKGNNNMETKEEFLIPLVKHQSVGGCGEAGYIYVCHH